MLHYVTFEINARYMTEVDADNRLEAERFALEDFYGADFGDAFDIECEIVKVEDEDGITIYRR